MEGQYKQNPYFPNRPLFMEGQYVASSANPGRQPLFMFVYVYCMIVYGGFMFHLSLLGLGPPSCFIFLLLCVTYHVLSFMFLFNLFNLLFVLFVLFLLCVLFFISFCLFLCVCYFSFLVFHFFYYYL